MTTTKQFENYQDALGKFQNVVLEGTSIQDADTDLLSKLFSTIFESGLKNGLKAAIKIFKLSTGTGFALSVSFDLINAVRDELARSGKAIADMAAANKLQDWVNSQFDALGKARDSFRKANFIEVLNNGFLEADDIQLFYEELFQAKEILGQVTPPSSLMLERLLYEGWINTHFKQIGPDSSGCIALEADVDDDGITINSFTVKAPEQVDGSIAHRLNSMNITTWSLKVRKRLCFRVDGGSRQCGWLNKNNEVIHVPLNVVATEKVRDKFFRSSPSTKHFTEQ